MGRKCHQNAVAMLKWVFCLNLIPDICRIVKILMDWTCSSTISNIFWPSNLYLDVPLLERNKLQFLEKIISFFCWRLIASVFIFPVPCCTCNYDANIWDPFKRYNELNYLNALMLHNKQLDNDSAMVFKKRWSARTSQVRLFA